MFLRCHTRKKNGKLHRYWSVVESRRVAGGDPLQRPVLYLGEINDSQEAAWRKTVAVFDEQRQRYEQLALFPCDRALPADEANALSLVLTELRLLRPRSFGDCWLGCLLWDELGLSGFWDARLSGQRGEVPWRKVLQLLVVNRLCAPGSEFAVHARWFDRSAMDELLGVDFAVAETDSPQRTQRGLARNRSRRFTTETRSARRPHGENRGWMSAAIVSPTHDAGLPCDPHV